MNKNQPQYYLVNVTGDILLAGQVRMADTFPSRLRGLLGSAPLPAGSALVIKPCSAVHTWGMTYPLDILFVGDDGRVLKIVDCLKPWRGAWSWRGAWVAELPAGTAAATGTAPGDRVLCQRKL